MKRRRTQQKTGIVSRFMVRLLHLRLFSSFRSVDGQNIVLAIDLFSTYNYKALGL